MTTQGQTDPYHLQRFLDAQQGIYDRVLTELRAARKTSHWMWFIFPQSAGLGFSDTARHFAISGRDEALAYLAHPILGTRLTECTRLVNQAPEGTTLDRIFGYPDDLKFHSSVTLFHAVAPEQREFAYSLSRFFAGELDRNTMTRLG